MPLTLFEQDKLRDEILNLIKFDILDSNSIIRSVCGHHDFGKKYPRASRSDVEWMIQRLRAQKLIEMTPTGWKKL